MMDRREALRRFGFGGVGAGLIAHRAAAREHQTRRAETGSDDRVVDVVLEGASVFRSGADGQRIEHDVSVRIAGNRIVDVGPGRLAGGDRIDMTGHLLLPGLISGHTHVAAGSPTRGIIESGRSYARPLTLVEEELSNDDLDALTAYNLTELLLSGCTSQVEMSMSVRQAMSYARVARRLGARGWVGGMVPGIGRLFPIWFGSDEDLIGSESATLEEIEANLSVAESLRREGDGLVLGMMTPHAADTQTPATLEAFAQAAAQLGTGIHTHLSQGQRETDTVRRRHGVTPTQWLADAGLMDGPFFGAHFTAPDWETDPDILIERGAVYATCPSAGGAGGATQPYPEALAAGLAVNVGIDTHSNDMLENVKLAVLQGQARAALLQEVGAGRPVRAPTVEDAIQGCTEIPARALGRPDLGVIEPGALADLVAVHVSGPLSGSGAPAPEPLNNILYTSGRFVSWVFVDGRPLVSDGQFALDLGTIVSAGGRVAQRLWGLLDEEGWF